MKIKLYTIANLALFIVFLSSCLDASSLMDKEDVGDLYEEVTKRVYFIGNERMLIAHDSNRLRFS